MIESISDALSAFGFFGAGLALLMALAQRLKPKKEFQVSLFYTAGCIAIWQMGLVYVHAGYDFSNPVLLQLTIPALAASGPLIYGFFAQMGKLDSSLVATSDELPDHSGRIHFVLPGLLLAAVFVLPFEQPLREYLLIFATLMLAAYCTAAAIHLRQLWCLETLKQRSNRHLWCLICLALLGLTLDLISQSLHIPIMGQLSDGCVSVMLIYIFLLQQQYPELQDDIEQQSIEQQESYSHLKQLNLDDTQQLLERLMTDEQLYLDENLKMTQLAAQAGLSTHQLSQFLNKHLQVNFSRFVNHYRILDAQRLLIQEPEASILSIGLSVGFANSSSFHTAFKKDVGLTPGQYRREQ